MSCKYYHSNIITKQRGTVRANLTSIFESTCTRSSCDVIVTSSFIISRISLISCNSLHLLPHYCHITSRSVFNKDISQITYITLKYQLQISIHIVTSESITSRYRKSPSRLFISQVISTTIC